MSGIAHRVILSFGLPRALIALASGAVGALAMPPFGVFPALVLALVPAVWLIDGIGGGRAPRAILSAAAIGWLWGFGAMVAGLWWLGSAFLVEAEVFAWALPLGVVGLPAALAFFHAAGFALARLLWSPGAARILALAAGLGASEWLRGTLFTGFPWNSLGLALGQDLWPMQLAAIVGLHGLAPIAVAIAAAPATLGTGRGARARLLPSALAALALAGILAFGAARIPAAPQPTVPDVALRIMQPNLPTDEKFSPENREAIMRRYLEISDRAASPERSSIADVTHLIWPESAFPFLLHRDARALAQIAAFLPRGTTLITGAARIDDAFLPGEEPVFFNSVQVVGQDGTIRATYDKVHLVPFGEYLPAPFAAILDLVGLRPFVAIPGGFAAGERRRLLDVPGLPAVAASVCYEAIFPGAVVPEGTRPGLLLNVTNDGWFGDTPGPRQHFAQARLRAVEEGLPLVRAANTGISAVVDPYGRIVGMLPVGVAGVVDSALPQARPPTLFAQWGDGVFAILLLLCATAAVVLRVRER